MNNRTSTCVICRQRFPEMEGYEVCPKCLGEPPFEQARMVRGGRPKLSRFERYQRRVEANKKRRENWRKAK